MRALMIFWFLFVFVACLYAQPEAVGEPRLIAKAYEALAIPVWSPDGKKLSFNDGQWEVASNGKNLKRVATKARVQRKNVNNPLLQQMNDDPRGVASKVKAMEQFSGLIIFDAVLSPRGDKIVFEVSRGKGMFVCNADGSEIRSLGVRAEWASWTPDGKYIVVMYVEDDGHFITKGELHSINVETGERSVLFASDKYVALYPALSPDGKKLAFENRAEGSVYVLDIK